jgi:hypothetical protein
MTTLQIKNRLINRIKAVDNHEVLEEVLRMLDLEFDNDEKLKVPAHVKKSILKGAKEIKEGKFHTNKQADREIDKWLRK